VEVEGVAFAALARIDLQKTLGDGRLVVALQDVGVELGEDLKKLYETHPIRLSTYLLDGLEEALDRLRLHGWKKAVGDGDADSVGPWVAELWVDGALEFGHQHDHLKRQRSVGT
jgi:hypothetical protein